MVEGEMIRDGNASLWAPYSISPYLSFSSSLLNSICKLRRRRFNKTMAQRTEKEETEFKVLETLTTTATLCTNNCGVTANPATNNMCQKCFNASLVTATAGVVDSGSILKRSARSVNLRSSPAKVVIRPREIDAVKRDQQIVNRCSGCRKKVGLTGFRCRCGDLFCSEHRYSDRHDCSYDYKTAGREAIARENPVVKAAKMVKV